MWHWKNQQQESDAGQYLRCFKRWLPLEETFYTWYFTPCCVMRRDGAQLSKSSRASPSWVSPTSESDPTSARTVIKNVHLNPKNKSPLKTIFMWKVTTLTQHKLPTFSLRKHLDTLILLQRLPNTPSKILTLHSQQTLHLPSKHFAPLKKCLRISINWFSKRSKHFVRK